MSELSLVAESQLDRYWRYSCRERFPGIHMVFKDVDWGEQSRSRNGDDDDGDEDTSSGDAVKMDGVRSTV